MMRFPIASFRALALIAAMLCAVTTAAAPQATMLFDFDGDAAVAARRQAYAAVARSGDLIAGAHLPFPGLVHVTAQDGGYRWAALDSSRADAAAQAK